jgi:hypothetical protein
MVAKEKQEMKDDAKTLKREKKNKKKATEVRDRSYRPGSRTMFVKTICQQTLRFRPCRCGFANDTDSGVFLLRCREQSLLQIQDHQIRKRRSERRIP